MELSETMVEAIAMVPPTWQRPPRKFRLRHRMVEFPMFNATFEALKRRGLVEWRGGPGTWEWRKAPAQ